MNTILAFIERNPNKSFFVALSLMFCYQCLNIFWGFEVLDPGFYLTIYQHFFDAPDTVTAAFGSYYLTNLIGGCLCNFFPGIGLLGFRICGALLVLFSIVIVFCALKNYVPLVHIILGGFLVVICYVKVSNTYTFSNGILSCFLYVCAIALLFKGLENQKLLLILLGGGVVGINVFSRLPNVLGLGLGLIALLNPFILRRERSFDWKKLLYYGIGCILGVALMCLLIFKLNHVDYFFNNVLDISNSATSSESDHSLNKLIIAQFFTYYNGLLTIGIFFTIFYFKNIYFSSRIANIAISIIAAAFLFYHIYLMSYVSDITWALCIAGGIQLLSMKQQGPIILYTLLGLYMIIVEPYGTNSGYGQASLPALIAAPVASMAIINRRNMVFVIIACLAILTKVINQGTYDEFGPIFQKQSFVNHPKAAHIHTTGERAKTFNIILNDLGGFVEERDTLLVWDSAPIFNYLTNTYPAGGSSCPLYKKSLLNKIYHTGSTPKILFLKTFNAEARKEPSCNQEKGKMSLGDFIKERDYSLVLENQYLMLYFPKQDLPIKEKCK